MTRKGGALILPERLLNARKMQFMRKVGVR